MDALKLEITLVVAAAAVLLNLWLATRVGRVRIANEVMVGDGGNEAVTRRMRAHANYVEYTPFFLILLAVIEMARGSTPLLWGVSLAYILVRIAHAFGMDGKDRLRMIGILGTMLILLGMAIWAIVIAYTGMSYSGGEVPSGINA